MYYRAIDLLSVKFSEPTLMIDRMFNFIAMLREYILDDITSGVVLLLLRFLWLVKTSLLKRCMLVEIVSICDSTRTSQLLDKVNLWRVSHVWMFLSNIVSQWPLVIAFTE